MVDMPIRGTFTNIHRVVGDRRRWINIFSLIIGYEWTRASNGAWNLSFYILHDPA